MSLKVVMAVFPLNDIFFETPCTFSIILKKIGMQVIKGLAGVEQPKFDFQVHYRLSTFFTLPSTFLGENKYI